MPLPRDRIVVFRLTQDEYKSLQAACSERGGRNISEFTRTELLALINQRRSAGSDIERRLAGIQLALRRLLWRLDTAPSGGAAPKPKRPDAQE
jgi:hypothetical protein